MSIKKQEGPFEKDSDTINKLIFSIFQDIPFILWRGFPTPALQARPGP